VDTPLLLFRTILLIVSISIRSLVLKSPKAALEQIAKAKEVSDVMLLR